ncbi:MAG: hypothetical protein HC916_14325 [Coleofasciculaceae cyanobacterium SM2_1_6]|nr:hypothetical protein [Coleofasciculaceae cyanobacterium SM2_1_6]
MATLQKTESSVFELVEQLRWVKALPLKQKTFAIYSIFLGMDWEVFLNSSAFKDDPEYKYISIIRLPCLSLLLLEWERGCRVHRHLDAAGNQIPAYIFGLKGRSMHSVFCIESQQGNDVYLSEHRNKILHPGELDYVLTTEAHYISPLESFTSIHLYFGSIVPNPNLNYKLL